MKAGYTITQYGVDDFTTIQVFNWYQRVGMVQYYDDFVIDDTTNLVAIFRVKPKVECDKCGKLTKDKEDAAGNIYCQSCQDNRDEEQGTRFLNDAENFTSNDYSQYKSLK